MVSVDQGERSRVNAFSGLIGGNARACVRKGSAADRAGVHHGLREDVSKRQWQATHIHRTG